MAHEAEELERRFWSAAGDPAFYREHFADEGRCVFFFGVLDKDATVASMEQAEPWSAVDLDDLVVTTLGDGVVALTYAARARRGNEAYEAMVTSTYVRRGDRWQLALHQQTPRRG